MDLSAYSSSGRNGHSSPPMRDYYSSDTETDGSDDEHVVEQTQLFYNPRELRRSPAFHNLMGLNNADYHRGLVVHGRERRPHHHIHNQAEQQHSEDANDEVPQQAGDAFPSTADASQAAMLEISTSGMVRSSRFRDLSAWAQEAAAGHDQTAQQENSDPDDDAPDQDTSSNSGEPSDNMQYTHVYGYGHAFGHGYGHSQANGYGHGHSYGQNYISSGDQEASPQTLTEALNQRQG